MLRVQDNLYTVSSFCPSTKTAVAVKDASHAPTSFGSGTRCAPSVCWSSDQTPTLLTGEKTVNNACATVAILNVIMNVEDVALGPGLREFKSATKALPPPHRGHLLDRNSFIRAVHNSVARFDSLSLLLLLIAH